MRAGPSTQPRSLVHYLCVCVLQELQRAVQLSPDAGFEKFMYLGQLLEGAEALAATQRGVEVLQQVRRAMVTMRCGSRV